LENKRIPGNWLMIVLSDVSFALATSKDSLAGLRLLAAAGGLVGFG
jgi:hypothetical protein